MLWQCVTVLLAFRVFTLITNCSAVTGFQCHLSPLLCPHGESKFGDIIHYRFVVDSFFKEIYLDVRIETNYQDDSKCFKLSVECLIS